MVLLIHERERSSKDFEESIAELKKTSFAEELQKQGYAVLALDYRGHGASTPRRTLGRSEWPNVVNDLQAAYYCLVDRHNRDELNLAKLGVVALGEGANVAATWAALGGAVSSEGRASDLGALVLVSPMVDAQSQGVPAKPADHRPGRQGPARPPRRRARRRLVRPGRRRAGLGQGHRQAVPGQQGRDLPLGTPRLQAPPVRAQHDRRRSIQFLEGTIKSKGDEWEGRYLFTPVTYSDVKIIKNPVRVDPAAAKKAAN